MGAAGGAAIFKTFGFIYYHEKAEEANENKNLKCTNRQISSSCERHTSATLLNIFLDTAEKGLFKITPSKTAAAGCVGAPWARFCRSRCARARAIGGLGISVTCATMQKVGKCGPGVHEIFRNVSLSIEKRMNTDTIEPKRSACVSRLQTCDRSMSTSTTFGPMSDTEVNILQPSTVSRDGKQCCAQEYSMTATHLLN